LLLAGSAAAETTVRLSGGLKGEVIQITSPPTFRLCVGIPRVDNQYFFPMQGYTDIQPGQSVTVHYQFTGGGEKGERLSLALDVGRIIALFISFNLSMPGLMPLAKLPPLPSRYPENMGKGRLFPSIEFL
jgi:hypothetical protein